MLAICGIPNLNQAILILTLGLGAVLVSGCSRAITESPSAIAARIADQDCVLSSADRQERNADDLDFVARQEVRWVEEDHALSYQVGLTALSTTGRLELASTS